MIELVVDFVSVNALLALQPAKQLADELGVDLKITPMRTVSELNVVRQESSLETIGERHRRVRAEYTRQDAFRYAAVQGIDMAIDGNDCDSTVALQGLLAANAEGFGFAYADHVFRRFWKGELQLNSVSDITTILAAVGVPQFDQEDAQWCLDPVRAELIERGVFAVPMFLVDGERYLGRQHLPMIRWQLESYVGQGPL